MGTLHNPFVEGDPTRIDPRVEWLADRSGRPLLYTTVGRKKVGYEKEDTTRKTQAKGLLIHSLLDP